MLDIHEGAESSFNFEPDLLNHLLQLRDGVLMNVISRVPHSIVAGGGHEHRATWFQQGKATFEHA